MSNDFEGEDDPRLREIYCLRGAYVSEVAEVEDWMDIIATRMGRPVPDDLHEKVTTTRQIARDIGVEPQMDQALAATRRMQKTRQGIAHARVTLEIIGDIEPPDPEMPWMAVRTKRGERIIESIDLAQLRNNVRAVRWLREYMIALSSAVRYKLEGRDPAETLDFMQGRLPKPNHTWLPDQRHELGRPLTVARRKALHGEVAFGTFHRYPPGD
jgi:hypothetical protein